MSLPKTKAYPLSDGDIRQLLGNDIKIVTYPQLSQMRSIDEAFDSKGRSIMLIPNQSPTSGHWVAMLKKPAGIEFFDSYGDAPEEQKGGMSQSRLQALDIERPDLTRLLRASGKPVYYNTRDYQAERNNISTCGRHAVSRLLYSPYSLDRYDKVIQSSGMNPDDFVTGLTYSKLKK